MKKLKKKYFHFACWKKKILRSWLYKFCRLQKFHKICKSCKNTKIGKFDKFCELHKSRKYKIFVNFVNYVNFLNSKKLWNAKIENWNKFKNSLILYLEKKNLQTWKFYKFFKLYKFQKICKTRKNTKFC